MDHIKAPGGLFQWFVVSPKKRRRGGLSLDTATQQLCTARPQPVRG